MKLIAQMTPLGLEHHLLLDGALVSLAELLDLEAATPYTSSEKMGSSLSQCQPLDQQEEQLAPSILRVVHVRSAS